MDAPDQANTCKQRGLRKTPSTAHPGGAGTTRSPSPLVARVLITALEADLSMVILTLQTRCVKNSKAKSLARSNKASKWQSWDSDQATWLHAPNHCLSKHHPAVTVHYQYPQCKRRYRSPETRLSFSKE